jgi:Ni,Fe-hydrogenase I large subunit
LITKQLIDQIEGEATIYFDIKKGVVDFATVAFPHFRGMESMLEGKKMLDALVLTPRVCGICGHAHLMATVRALEDAYKNASYPLKLSSKVEKLREFTLVMEMIQNHLKWLYMTILPEIQKLTKDSKAQTPLKGAFGSSLASKAIAIFAGQWPHSSYMIPGGITSDPTNIDILKAQTYLEELIRFFEKEALGCDLEKFLSFESCKDFNILDGDIGYLESSLMSLSMEKKGFADDRFLVIGNHTFTKPAKLRQTRHYHVDSDGVATSESFAPKTKSYAQNAHYKGQFYETGPLARLISSNHTLIKNIHRRFKDSAYSRVMARVCELSELLLVAKELLKGVDISQESYLPVVSSSKISAVGVGVVEAPRGPLLHRIEIEDGIIKSYNIITPTQFNIGSSTPEKPTPVQRAMNGVSKEDALFIFRTFDVCSVCTTH